MDIDAIFKEVEKLKKERDIIEKRLCTLYAQLKEELRLRNRKMLYGSGEFVAVLCQRARYKLVDGHRLLESVVDPKIFAQTVLETVTPTKRLIVALEKSGISLDVFATAYSEYVQVRKAGELSFGEVEAEVEDDILVERFRSCVRLL